MGSRQPPSSPHPPPAPPHLLRLIPKPCCSPGLVRSVSWPPPWTPVDGAAARHQDARGEPTQQAGRDTPAAGSIRRPPSLHTAAPPGLGPLRRACLRRRSPEQETYILAGGAGKRVL